MQHIILYALLLAIVPTAIAGIVAMSRTTPGKHATSPPRRSRAAEKALRTEMTR